MTSNFVLELIGIQLISIKYVCWHQPENTQSYFEAI